MANKENDIGIVRGLAWTSAGGDTLEIEVNVMPGKGEFALTGKLGDVMKESAKAGISYIRSIGPAYHIDRMIFSKRMISISTFPRVRCQRTAPLPESPWRRPCCRPSSKRPVRADLAMTGEITLRGRVLPIGGLKEKLLAAKSAGIRTVLVPKKNEDDVAEISARDQERSGDHSGGKHEPGAGAGAGGRVNEMECLAIEREGTEHGN